jgi:membrane protein DedA with SNARE-associated domain
MEELIATHGYIAVFIGTFLEGETILALAGVAAAYGYLSFALVCAVAVMGAFLGDQVCFFVGRRYGHRVLARFPKLAAKAPRVQALLRRWDAPAVIMLRFAYGLRIAGPIVIGTCGISPWRLAFFNFIGALIWAPIVAGVGYLAGYALHEWMGKLKNAQVAILVAALLIAAVVWLVLRRRHKTGTGS